MLKVQVATAKKPNKNFNELLVSERAAVKEIVTRPGTYGFNKAKKIETLETQILKMSAKNGISITAYNLDNGTAYNLVKLPVTK